MIPLNLARPGDEASVKKIGGSDETRRFLEKLGFVSGARLSVVTENNGCMIVVVKETRVAVSREMAMKIMI